MHHESQILRAVFFNILRERSLVESSTILSVRIKYAPAILFYSLPRPPVVEWNSIILSHTFDQSFDMSPGLSQHCELRCPTSRILDIILYDAYLVHLPSVFGKPLAE